jgi:hypothetical protein
MIGTKSAMAETAEVSVIDVIIGRRTEIVETNEIRTEKGMTKEINMKINPAAVSEEIMTVVTV